MLKRILSAFLLCLCISPVWGVDCPITDNYRDYIKSGGDTPTCEVKGVSNTKGACVAVGDYWVTAIDKLKYSILVACDANLLGRQYDGCWYYKQGLVYDEDTENYYYRWEHYNPKEIKINAVGTSAWLPPCVLDYDWDLNENRVPYEEYVTWYAGCDSYADRVLIRGDRTEITTPYYVSFRDESLRGGCAERVGDSPSVNPDMVYCYAYKCKEGYHINNRRCVNDDASGESSESATVPAQSTISESKQRCLESRESGEGKACCHWAETVAKWENNKCVCVNPNKVFKMNDDGQTGSCVDKTAGASQSSDVTDDEVRALLSTPSGDCANEEKRIIPIGENDSCGTDARPVSVEACVKNMIVPDEVLPNVGAQQIGVTSRGFAGNTQGCFNENNIPGNNKYKLSFLGYKPVYVCANQLKKDKVVCLEQDSELDDVIITSAYDCEQDVLAKLNAVSGKKKFWDSIEDGYAKAYCDIVCADGHTRQEQETIVEFQEHGETFKTKQRYICVANGDVTTDNTATPTPGGGDNSGATAPAKPDGTPCTPTDKNAKSGKYQNGECIIVECKESYYKVSDDKKSCVEDKKAKSQAKIDELQKNADAMKEKEQSTANKLLGGAAIGATGIGAMQAASAYSEQQADEEAEQAMKAYLATFHCNYGGGINVKGGEKDVQLPGGNELIDLYAEYVNLANNLKVRKAALDLRPGIESEAILDSATSGLYDDVAIGKTSGAFTSLARALQDPEGEDAKAWAAQKDASAKKMKTGLTVAAIGAIGGAVGNLLINRKSEKENSKNILDKYKDGDLTGKVSKSPDGKLVAEPVNQESKPEPGIAIQDKDLGQETNMNQNQSGNWVHIVKPYAVGFYCEDLFENVYRSCFAMNNEDYARFQQSKFSEITNNAEKCYQGLANCKQESHTLASIEEACIRAVASDFSIDVSGVNNANCTDKYKTDFTWKSHIFQEQSTVDADATAIVKDGQMILVSPDPSTGERVETVVEESQESTPKQDNVVKDHHHGDGVDYIKRIENITDADAAFNMLAQQFGKTPSDEVKNTYDGFVTTCRRYNGVLSIELDTLRSYERDMYQVLCYFPDLDQTPDIVKVAYNTDHRVLDNSVSISEEIRLSKLAPFKDTQYKKNEDAFWQRLTEFNSNWSTSSRNCKIPELPSLWACTKYSAMIRIHDRDGKMYLEMTKYDRPAGNSDNYFVGKW